MQVIAQCENEWNTHIPDVFLRKDLLPVFDSLRYGFQSHWHVDALGLPEFPAVTRYLTIFANQDLKQYPRLLRSTRVSFQDSRPVITTL